MKKLFFFFAFSLCTLGITNAQSTKNTFKKFGKDVGSAGKKTGKEVGKGGKQVGQASARFGKDVAKKSKQAVGK
jgi:hypothetical protein